jgi:hypothetical protein
MVMNKPPYEIGEKVFVVSATPYGQERIPCPICAGKLAVTLILGSGEHQTVECESCRAQGTVTRHAPSSSVTEMTVTGISYDQSKWKIACDEFSRDLADIFRDPEAAEARREKRHAEVSETAEDNFVENIGHRKKGHTWSAGYHRKYIKDLQRQLEWHKAKLSEKKEKK